MTPYDDRQAERDDQTRLHGDHHTAGGPAPLEWCPIHGEWAPVALIDECPECLRDEAFTREGRWGPTYPRNVRPGVMG